MIELPVQKRSASVTKPKRGDDHSTSSSAKRDRWIMISAAAASNSIAKSRSPTASSEFEQSAVEAELAGDPRAIDRERRAGERGGAERQAVDAPAAVGEALGIAREHRVVGEQVMAEGDRLRDLQMSEAGHDRVGVALGEVDEARAAARRAAPAGASISPRSHRRTSVATWSLRERAGVQALAGVADQRRQPPLDVEMDVLEVARPNELPRAISSPIVGEPALDRPRGRCAETIPTAASIRACASDPAMSAAARRRSKSTDAV